MVDAFPNGWGDMFKHAGFFGAQRLLTQRLKQGGLRQRCSTAAAHTNLLKGLMARHAAMEHADAQWDGWLSLPDAGYGGLLELANTGRDAARSALGDLATLCLLDVEASQGPHQSRRVRLRPAALAELATELGAQDGAAAGMPRVKPGMPRVSSSRPGANGTGTPRYNAASGPDTLLLSSIKKEKEDRSVLSHGSKGEPQSWEGVWASQQARIMALYPQVRATAGYFAKLRSNFKAALLAALGAQRSAWEARSEPARAALLAEALEFTLTRIEQGNVQAGGFGRYAAKKLATLLADASPAGPSSAMPPDAQQGARRDETGAGVSEDYCVAATRLYIAPLRLSEASPEVQAQLRELGLGDDDLLYPERIGYLLPELPDAALEPELNRDRRGYLDPQADPAQILREASSPDPPHLAAPMPAALRELIARNRARGQRDQLSAVVQQRPRAA